MNIDSMRWEIKDELIKQQGEKEADRTKNEGTSNLVELETTLATEISRTDIMENRDLKDRKRTKEKLANGRHGGQIKRDLLQIKHNLNN